MTALSHAETLGRYLGAFVDELVACGLEDVCLCPGSRSAPLALTFARHPRIKLWTHLDERSCAYFALGMAKARSARPVAVLCSSGTAAVNLAPAVVEAFHSRAPLIVLTADRPPELQGVGANQTIDQNRLYGSAVKWFVDMPLPDASDEMLRYVRMVATRAVSTIRSQPRGPIHLNFPFREPLIPAAYEPRLDPNVLEATSIPEGDTETPLRDSDFAAVASAERGVIVCGPNAGVTPSTIAGLAEKTRFPVLADALSGVRCGAHAGPSVISAYDAFLRSPNVIEALAPDFVLRLGDPPTSKPLATYLARNRSARQLVVAPPGLWPDPDLTADDIVYGDADAFCGQLAGHLEARKSASNWLDRWQRADACALDSIRRAAAEDESVSEPSVVLDLAAVIPDGATVFAGNSMPVRDIDTFWPADDRAVRFLANRGASGIDGVVSSALGAAAVTEGRLVLVIGDLSFYHDMNGLLAARRHAIDATIVLVNNDGGGIFSFLPQNDDQTHFETLFGTPHGLDFRPVAALYGLGWQTVATREAYRQALLASFDAPGVQVVEVKTDRRENLALHQRVWRAVAAAVADGRPA